MVGIRITKEEKDSIYYHYECGYTDFKSLASMLGLSESSVRKVVREYRESLRQEQEEYELQQEQHEEWRLYECGVFVRWFGPLRMAVNGGDGKYRYWVKCEERRIFYASSQCYRTAEAAMQGADENAQSCYGYFLPS
ncbi:hypothetical protein M4951_01180 [Blastopirellula sp. J2-11]|uniref:hypothetical protein n=1 Tax=Blastopirellula sp. J2-11 TaxID=2943192 RepID=UPI0021C62A49|nr:hypothetical protein [Blastopirellula sp. J2-11]UUO06938.1 hypothetical protein M4951_01180 [Blastopirellula sp. J2-11]